MDGSQALISTNRITGRSLTGQQTEGRRNRRRETQRLDVQQISRFIEIYEYHKITTKKTFNLLTY